MAAAQAALVASSPSCLRIKKKIPSSPSCSASCGARETTVRASISLADRLRGDPNSRIREICERGDLKEAMGFIAELDSGDPGFEPETYSSLLQLCADVGSSSEGKLVHSILSTSNIDVGADLGFQLVFMSLKCGNLREGRRVFERLSSREDVLLWNLLISDYSKAGEFEESISFFYRMQSSGVTPDAHTFTCILKCFAHLGCLNGGEKIHGFLLKMGFNSYTAVENSLLFFYGKSFRIDSALKLFDEMLQRDIISWNSVISGCVSNGLAQKGLELFKEMYRLGFGVDLATIVSVLPACSELGLLELGRVLHSYSIKSSLGDETKACNSLINMYSKCGDLESAMRAFEKMNRKSVVSWNSMISGYTSFGKFDKAFELFVKMESEGVSPDPYTISTFLQACSCYGALEKGKLVHDYAVRIGLESDMFVMNALIDMYAKCGSIEDARLVFDCAERKDIVSWNAMIGGYSRIRQPDKALCLFREMLLLHMRCNSVTVACILPACASLSLLERGREIHGHTLRAGLLLDGPVSNALVDMYAKCGAIRLAGLLFKQMATKDLFSWTVMIAGYGIHGRGKDAVAAFNEMRLEGVWPDKVSFLAIMYACSHSGLLDEGWRFFNRMRNEYKIEPNMEHCACMVDLMGRAGRLSKAYKFVQSMPIEPDSTIWATLLSWCRIHRDVALAERVAEHLFELDPENSGNYVVLANIYAEAEKWETVKKMVEKMGGNKEKRNNPSCCSWIEVRSKTHVFVSGSNNPHPQSRKIERFLQQVRNCKEKRNSIVSGDDDSLCSHSEKQAIAFGILNTSQGIPVRVAKNTRVCGDCHEFAKFVSRMFHRDIVLRDSNRFHHFEEGRCSCRGYW